MFLSISVKNINTETSTPFRVVTIRSEDRLPPANENLALVTCLIIQTPEMLPRRASQRPEHTLAHQR